MYECLLVVILCLLNGIDASLCSSEEYVDCSCYPDLKVQLSWDNLVFQYTNPPLPHNEYCSRGREDLKIWTNYANQCGHGELQKMLNVTTKRYENILNIKCPGKKRTSYIHLPPYARVGGCNERFVNAMYYNLANIPSKDQLSVLNCITREKDACFPNDDPKIWDNATLNVAKIISKPFELYGENLSVDKQICETYKMK